MSIAVSGVSRHGFHVRTWDAALLHANSMKESNQETLLKTLFTNLKTQGLIDAGSEVSKAGRDLTVGAETKVFEVRGVGGLRCMKALANFVQSLDNVKFSTK